MRGVSGYGSYLPCWRLARADIAAALLTPAGNGTRAVASFDEDSTTLAVAAAREALRTVPGPAPQRLLFATTAPAYLDTSNAAIVHAALGLPADTFAADVLGSVRSGAAALLGALEAPVTTLVALSDLRGGRPGSADETQGGDAAAAFLIGPGRVLAEPVAFAANTEATMDRWRLPAEDFSRVWEERFGEHALLPLAERAVTDALKSAGLSPTEVDRLVVAGSHPRAARALPRLVGVRPEAVGDDLSATVGNPGAAQFGLLLADAFDRAAPGERVLSVLLADGAFAVLWRVTEQLPAYRAARASTVAAQVAAGRPGPGYATYLGWRGRLDREPPRRPDPTAPAAPPAYRRRGWKYAFTASRCTACGTRHLPPARVCLSCAAVDQMTAEPMSEVPATVATYTVDRLAFTPNPPLVAAVLDFDGGGRYRCELTDVDPAKVAVGQRMQLTFRRISTARGVHNYFWKARPAPSTEPAGPATGMTQATGTGHRR